MSTFSRSASSLAERSGRTLKPITMAWEAEANRMSLALIGQAEAWSALMATCSVESFASVSLRTSTEPCTSALRTTLSAMTSSDLIFSISPSRLTLQLPAICSSRCLAWR